MPLSVLSLLVHAYIAWRLIPDLGDFPWAQIGIALLVTLSAVSMQAGFNHWRSRRLQQTRRHDIVMVAAFMAMGFLSSLFVLTLLRDVALASLWIGGQLGLSLPFSAVAVGSALAVPAVATLITLWGLFNARRTARVVEVDVPTPICQLRCMASRLRRSATFTSARRSKVTICSRSCAR